jgi:16S rRNA (guanine527-N7)-methyltransferase
MNSPSDSISDPSPSEPSATPYQGSEKQLVQELQSSAQSIGIGTVPQEAWLPLARYCLLVWDWNTKINLTRHTQPDLFVKRDLLDSVMLAQQLQPNEEILDIGTGGGVPGILVAILRPDVQVTLCDSVAKKARVAQEIVDKLGLNVPVYPQSVTKVLEDFRYDSLVARAVGPLARLCGWLREDWHKIGRLLAIKGPKWVEERGEARHRGLLKGLDLRRLVSYRMPDTESESTILQLSRQMGRQPVDET